MPTEAVDAVAAAYGLDGGEYGAMRAFTRADADFNLRCPAVEWAWSLHVRRYRQCASMMLCAILVVAFVL
jgi:hypothetical protein